MNDRFRGCLLGLAAGDALGTTVEFRTRGSFPPLTDIIGGGPFRLRAGQWTDDTSMALCLGTSLVARGGFDATDQMERYCRWYEDGYLSSTGTCFDVGGTVAAALDRFQRDGNPFAGARDANSAGNGSLMRLAPVPIFCYPDIDLAERLAAESSRTTHGAEECLDACRLAARIMIRALRGETKDEVLLGDASTFRGAASITFLARGGFRTRDETAIRGSGYVVESLEAALWCFDRTSSFEDAVILAANLGDDADTTAAVCGQIAGAYYGLAGIPSHWLARLTMYDDMCALVDQLADGSPTEPSN